MNARRSNRFKSEEDEREKKDIKVESNDGDLGDVEIEQLDDYEKIRLENIQRNAQFLHSIGIQDVKSDLHLLSSSTNTSSSNAKPSSRGLSGKRKATSQVSQPPRRSGRVTIERLRKEIDETVASGVADSTLLDQKRVALETMVAEKASTIYDATPANSNDDYAATRLSSDPIPLLTPLNQPKHADDSQSLDWGHGLLPILRTDGKSLPSFSAASAARRKESSVATYRANIASLQVVETDVAKVVPQRITALVMHPAQDRTLVVAGDKQGHVGFWNADESNDVIGGKAQVGGEDGVYLYRPHVGNISCLYIPPHVPEQLWTTSYDGTLRRMDVEQQAFVECYRAPGELGDVSFHDAAFSNTSGMAYVGCRSGEIVAVDLKSGSAGWTTKAHDGKINSIQVHPQHEHILVSASTGMTGYIAVHDVRKASSSAWKPLFTLNKHTKSINAAYLSPGTGDYMVSVSLDNTVKIWKDIMTNTSNPVVTSFAHDNHTGRWLSTLQPCFDPHADRAAYPSFLLGSMAKPRRLELYTLPPPSSSLSSSIKMDPVILAGDHMGSVCSRNCFHPSRKNVIAGGNSSGKVHLFR